MIYTKREIATATKSSSNQGLSVMGIFEIVEDVITELTASLHVDGVTLKNKYNAFWVFSKNKTEIFKKIAWNEHFTLNCFISSKSLVKIYYDVEARNDAGELLFYSRIEACALDLTTQMIRKLSTVGVDETIDCEKERYEITYGRIDYEDLPVVENVKVRSTNIDMSHHTNNIEYMRFILNTYSVDELETKSMKSVEVHYTSQSYENDTLQVLKKSFEDRDIIFLEKDQKPVIKCEVTFN